MDFNLPKLKKLISRLQEELPAGEDAGGAAPEDGDTGTAQIQSEASSLLSRIIDEEEESDSAN